MHDYSFLTYLKKNYTDYPVKYSQYGNSDVHKEYIDQDIVFVIDKNRGNRDDVIGISTLSLPRSGYVDDRRLDRAFRQNKSGKNS